jgi:hypothetical protein
VQPYSVQKIASVSGGVDYDVLPQRLTAGTWVQYSYSWYDAEAAPVNLPSGTEDLTEVGVKGSYKLNRHFSVDAQCMFQNWDSDVREKFWHYVLYFGVTAQL